jgi:lipopolysaccharide/colanic/teichoic acid biosynthesis glycosyltransferase
MTPTTDTRPSRSADRIAHAPHVSDVAKSTFDCALALILLVPALPLILLSALLVKLTSRGPALYSQARVGLGGRNFRIYKIRTMYHDAEAVSGARWSACGDSRVTAVGWFLRRTHLDELPQLWNVLRGDMSLIGPRPERPEFVVHLEQAIPGYRVRLEVRPGVTGLAQIQLPPDTNLQSVRDKLVLDRCYVEERNWWLDVRILVGTGLKLLGFSYATIRRVLALPTGRVADDGLAEGVPEPQLGGT